MGRVPERAGAAGRTAGDRAAAARARGRSRPLKGDLALRGPGWVAPLGAQLRHRRRVGRLVVCRRFFTDRKTFDSMASFFELPLTELEILAAAGDRGDRLFEAELPPLARSSRRIQLPQPLPVA